MDTVLFMTVGRIRTPIGSWSVNTHVDNLLGYVQALKLAKLMEATATGARMPEFELVKGA